MQTGKRDERIGRADASDSEARVAQHTPGPWRAVNNGTFWQIDSDDHGQVGDTCASEFIFIDGIMQPEEWANPIAARNAQLMAAAPELLAAVRALLNFTPGTFGHEKAVALGESAIAKATQPSASRGDSESNPSRRQT